MKGTFVEYYVSDALLKNTLLKEEDLLREIARELVKKTPIEELKKVVNFGIYDGYAPRTSETSEVDRGMYYKASWNTDDYKCINENYAKGIPKCQSPCGDIICEKNKLGR